MMYPLIGAIKGGMMMYEIRSSVDWLKDFPNLVILDPDGWDRSNFDESWAELISREEFLDRVTKSTLGGGFHYLIGRHDGR